MLMNLCIPLELKKGFIILLGPRVNPEERIVTHSTNPS